MANMRMLDRLVEKYGGKVANLFGVQELPVALSVGYADGNAAGTAGQSITFDKKYLKGASRADVRGAVIHELTHAYGVGADTGKVETYADYARLVLNKNENPDWTPSDDVVTMAEKRGDMAYGTDNNGPGHAQGPPQDGNRARNTYTNQRTHQDTTIGYKNPGGAAALPALDPASTANYYAQLGNFYALYENQLAASKAARVGLKADARVGLADVKQQEIGSLATSENAGIDRGVSGGSADLQERIGIRGAAASARADVKSTLHQGIAESRLTDQQAALTLYQNQTGLEAQSLAQRQELLADQLERNAIISGAEMQADAMTSVYRALMNAGNPNGPGRRNNPGPYRPGDDPVYPNAPADVISPMTGRVSQAVIQRKGR